MADLISFARGAPSADLLPVDAVREAAAKALADDANVALSYGTGVGHTALGEWIVERHGGNIAVEDDHGHGSQFVLTLPRMRTAPEDGAPVA